MPKIKTEIMHMYDGDDRKVAELDIANKSGAEVADIIEIQEMVGRQLEQQSLLLSSF